MIVRQSPRCRSCGGTPPLVRFAPLTTRKCLACGRVRQQAGIKSPVKRPTRRQEGRCAAHLAWIRALPCACGVRCGTRIHAHHVRTGTGGGTGMKPSDCWAVPLCAAHHLELHQRGSRSFEVLHRLDLRELAIALAAQSPHLLAGAALE